MADADFPRLRADVAAIAALLEPGPKDLRARLGVAVGAIKDRIIFTTSFGIEDQLIAHHIFSDRLPIEVVTLDTGRLFPETYRVWQKTEERYQVRVRAVYPNADTLAALIADQGINGFFHSKDARLACCAARKIEPLRRALSGAGAWLTGLRARQSAGRASTKLVEWDLEHGLVKIAPLFDFTRDEVAADCTALEVPVNELHAQGFASIGCAPCTRAIQPGETERAGRWWWERDDSKECGLHVDPSGRLVRSAAA